jgi:hypothetical protein
MSGKSGSKNLNKLVSSIKIIMKLLKFSQNICNETIIERSRVSLCAP